MDVSIALITMSEIPKLELNGKKEDLEIAGDESLEEAAAAAEEVGQIVHAIGNFGKWQLRKCLFICLIIWLPASFHLLNMVFFR